MRGKIQKSPLKKNGKRGSKKVSLHWFESWTMNKASYLHGEFTRAKKITVDNTWSTSVLMPEFGFWLFPCTAVFQHRLESSVSNRVVSLLQRNPVLLLHQLVGTVVPNTSAIVYNIQSIYVKHNDGNTRAMNWISKVKYGFRRYHVIFCHKTLWSIFSFGLK